MEQRKLEVGPLFDGIWIFIKEQLKRLDTWAMISCLSYLGTFGLGMLIGLLIVLAVGSFVVGYSFFSFPVAFIIPTLFSLVILFLVFKIAKKTIGIANVLMLNILAAVENKTLPKFSIRDERLSISVLALVYCLFIIAGLLLLVVPGIIFLIRFSMAYMIMLDEKCSIKEALQKSWELTEGNFWPMFVFIFPMILIGSLIPLFSIVYFFIPLNMWVYGYIYHQLKQR
jgi:hypothetical protein